MAGNRDRPHRTWLVWLIVPLLIGVGLPVALLALTGWLAAWCGATGILASWGPLAATSAVYALPLCIPCGLWLAWDIVKHSRDGVPPALFQRRRQWPLTMVVIWIMSGPARELLLHPQGGVVAVTLVAFGVFAAAYVKLVELLLRWICPVAASRRQDVGF